MHRDQPSDPTRVAQARCVTLAREPHRSAGTSSAKWDNSGPASCRAGRNVKETASASRPLWGGPSPTELSCRHGKPLFRAGLSLHKQALEPLASHRFPDHRTCLAFRPPTLFKSSKDTTKV